MPTHAPFRTSTSHWTHTCNTISIILLYLLNVKILYFFQIQGNSRWLPLCFTYCVKWTMLQTGTWEHETQAWCICWIYIPPFVAMLKATNGISNPKNKLHLLFCELQPVAPLPRFEKHCVKITRQFFSYHHIPLVLCLNCPGELATDSIGELRIGL